MLGMVATYGAGEGNALSGPQRKDPRQQDTPEADEEAGDITVNASCDAWCHDCGRIEIFPPGKCDHCRSQLLFFMRASRLRYENSRLSCALVNAWIRMTLALLTVLPNPRSFAKELCKLPLQSLGPVHPSKWVPD